MTLDATSSALWMSSDPSIASFIQPAGYLKVQTPGVVQVSARYNGLPSFPELLSFTVAPGNPAEQMLQLSIGVTDNSGSKLSGVHVDAIPDRGSPLVCQTNQFGACLDTNLWALPGTVLIRGTLAGYQTTEARFTSPTVKTLSWPISLKMMPLGR